VSTGYEASNTSCFRRAYPIFPQDDEIARNPNVANENFVDFIAK